MVNTLTNSSTSRGEKLGKLGRNKRFHGWDTKTEKKFEGKKQELFAKIFTGALKLIIV